MVPIFRYTERSQPPEGYLRGVFDSRPTSPSWKGLRERHLELVGPVLTVSRDREATSVILRQDVRDLTFCLGTGTRELVFKLPSGYRILLLARHLTHLATWMEALVAVVESGCVGEFYRFSLSIGFGKRGPVKLAWDKAVSAYSPVVVKDVKIEVRGAKFSTDVDLARVCADHKNLLTVVDVFQTLTREYIVTEYARGGSLDDILRGPTKSAINIEGLGSIGDWPIEHQFSEEDVRVLILELLKGLEVRRCSRLLTKWTTVC